MRAVRCRDGRVGLVDVPVPEGDGIRVRIASAGICGSDVHLVDRGMAGPQTLGHEFAGTLPDGRPVAVEPLAPCRKCGPCLAGDYNLCEGGLGMLLGVGLDGGMADEVRVPPDALVPLPGGVEARDGCLVEPLAVAAHGFRLAGLSGRTRVAVVGGGPIGLCAVAVARDGGAEVALVARHDHQAEAGARLGAGRPDGLYDLVVDAAGSVSAMEEAVRLCRPGGVILLLASYWDGAITLPGFAVSLAEIRIVPSSLYARAGATRDVDTAAAVLGRNPDLPATLVTHRFPLDAAAEAFETARNRRAGAIKVVLEP